VNTFSFSIDKILSLHQQNEFDKVKDIINICLNEALNLISPKHKHLSFIERIKQYYLEALVDYSCYFFLSEVAKVS